MCLSKAELPIEKQIFMVDMIKKTDSDNVIDIKVRARNAREIWTALAQNHLYLNISLLQVYLKQETCYWCGGQILKVNGISDAHYEKRCVCCGYIYEEK